MQYICVSHTAGCRVPDTTPAPEIVYQYAQGAQKGLTATKKKQKTKKINNAEIVRKIVNSHVETLYCTVQENEL